MDRTERGAPYGIAVDRRQGLVYVTLTATNRPESFRIAGTRMIPGPDLARCSPAQQRGVDGATCRVFVVGRTDSQFELIDPGLTAKPVTR